MSIRGSDFRCELDPEIAEMLRQMAAHRKMPDKALGCEFLEKAIAGEFHAFKVMLERLARSGILRRPADKAGE